MSQPPVSPSSLRRRVAAIIDRAALLPAGPVVVAFSGGPDSLGLLHLLADLAPGRGWRLVAAHLDHGLRPESAAEVASARALAAARAVPLVAARAEVGAATSGRPGGVEAAGRVARYRFLATVAAAEGGAPVVTGHTQDDQAETLLLRLGRGAGRAGLGAMRPVTLLPPAVWDGPPDAPPLRLVRPLLTISRAAIEADLAARGLTPLRDPSNADPAYTRNWLRQEVLGAWRRRAPGIAARLARAADILAAEEEYLAAATARAWADLNPDAAGATLAFDRAAFLAQPLALRRRLLRHAVQASGGGTSALAAIDLGLTVAAGPSGGRADLGGGLLLLTAADRLTIAPMSLAPVPTAPDRPWMTAGATAALRLAGTTVLPGEGWAIVSRHLPAAACAAPLSARHAHFLPTLATAGPLVRTWRPGDRLAPPGLAGHQKLSDLFINRKLPRAERAQVPLLVAGDTVAWVVGLAIGAPFQATAATPTVLCCQAIAWP